MAKSRITIGAEELETLFETVTEIEKVIITTGAVNPSDYEETGIFNKTITAVINKNGYSRQSRNEDQYTNYSKEYTVMLFHHTGGKNEMPEALLTATESLLASFNGDEDFNCSDIDIQPRGNQYYYIKIQRTY